MFPRRRTDQVYATLQQVQRRITEQGGQPSAVATPAGMSAPRTPSSGNPTPGAMPIIRPGPQIPAQHELPPLLPPGVGAHQRYAVQISGTLASLLLVCWIASIAAAVLITKQWSKPSAALAADPMPRAAVAAPTAAAQPRWKLIVLSEMRTTGEARTRLNKEREFLNDVARRTQGWQPLFEVEEGVNGGIQLVFGTQGVEKEPWWDMYNKLRKRHGSASWVELR
ncbi:MAG TPA: hypothetical protein DCS97_10970 [Planctomycetes bacterium]|nr:hypothetical protein [Planctomycetota bacterium]